MLNVNERMDLPISDRPWSMQIEGNSINVYNKDGDVIIQDEIDTGARVADFRHVVACVNAIHWQEVAKNDK